MFYQTSTTISLIASVLTFHTKNTLCATIQQTNPQNKLDLQNYLALQNSSQSNQDNEDESLTDILKNMKVSENEDAKDRLQALDKEYEAQIKEINIEYKKLKNPTQTEKSDYECEKLFLETYLILAKDVFQLKKGFTKEKYEKFLKHLDDIIEKMKGLQRKYSYVLADEDREDLSNGIKELQEIPERSEEIFTTGVVGNDEKEKIINIIEEVNNPTRKNISSWNKHPENNSAENEDPEKKDSLMKVFIWGGAVLGVFSVVLVIVIF